MPADSELFKQAKSQEQEQAWNCTSSLNKACSSGNSPVRATDANNSMNPQNIHKAVRSKLSEFLSPSFCEYRARPALLTQSSKFVSKDTSSQQRAGLTHCTVLLFSCYRMFGNLVLVQSLRSDQGQQDHIKVGRYNAIQVQQNYSACTKIGLSPACVLHRGCMQRGSYGNDQTIVAASPLASLLQF